MVRADLFYTLVFIMSAMCYRGLEWERTIRQWSMRECIYHVEFVFPLPQAWPTAVAEAFSEQGLYPEKRSPADSSPVLYKYEIWLDALCRYGTIPLNRKGHCFVYHETVIWLKWKWCQYHYTSMWGGRNLSTRICIFVFYIDRILFNSYIHSIFILWAKSKTSQWSHN